MSIEALAMAGMDYAESGIHIEEWENDRRYDQQMPPPHLHLFADDDENFENIIEAGKIRETGTISNRTNNMVVINNEEWRKRTRKWK